MGPEVGEFEDALAAFCGEGRALSCANGTDALALPLMAWGVGAGDAVFCPSFTFAATPEIEKSTVVSSAANMRGENQRAGLKSNKNPRLTPWVFADFLEFVLCGDQFASAARRLFVSRLFFAVFAFENIDELLHRGRKDFALLVNRGERTIEVSAFEVELNERLLVHFLGDGAFGHDRNARVDFHRAFHRFDIVELHDILNVNILVLKNLVDGFARRDIRLERHKLLIGQQFEAN
jgi:hypothetical protein